MRKPGPFLLQMDTMRSQTVASSSDILAPWRPGIWRFGHRGFRPVVAGVTDRSCDLDGLRAHLAFTRGVVLAEQVHGTSLAAIELPTPPPDPIPGCDGLTTTVPGLALLMRTADCLPIFLWDPAQRVVGLVHAGWRGLAQQVGLRVVGFLRQVYGTHPRDLWIGVGPSIRACCYEVGEGVAPLFGPFITERDGRLTCDLIGCATQQFLASGVRSSRLIDAGACTACDARRWWSVRRDGEMAGRLLSFMAIPL